MTPRHCCLRSSCLKHEVRLAKKDAFAAHLCCPRAPAFEPSTFIRASPHAHWRHWLVTAGSSPERLVLLFREVRSHLLWLSIHAKPEKAAPLCSFGAVIFPFLKFAHQHSKRGKRTISTTHSVLPAANERGVRFAGVCLRGSVCSGRTRLQVSMLPPQ